MRYSFISVAAVAALAGSASAGFVSATFTGVAPGHQVTINGGTQTHAGVYNFNYDGGTVPGLSPTFAGFCIEVTENISNGQSATWDTAPLQDGPTSLVGGMGGARAQSIRELFGRHFADAFLSNDNAAAFQLAVWELVYDDSYDLSSGAFSVSSAPAASITTANSYLSELDGSGPTLNVFALLKVGVQDYAVVPTPGSAALAALGLAAMRRRR